MLKKAHKNRNTTDDKHNTYILLVVLVCSITKYFYLMFALQACQYMAQLVKILGDTNHQKV